MTYEVHITRRESWADESGPKISREEWLTVVAEEPALVVSAGGGPSAVWSGHPDHVSGKDKEGILFLFSDWSGWLSVDQPDEITLTKMAEIAQTLAATVRGDDGEIYQVEEGRLVTLHLGAPVRFARGQTPGSVQQADGPLHREERRAREEQRDGAPPPRRRGVFRRAAGKVADRMAKKILG